jgi:hypothetical protein
MMIVLHWKSVLAILDLLFEASEQFDQCASAPSDFRHLSLLQLHYFIITSLSTFINDHPDIQEYTQLI